MSKKTRFVSNKRPAISKKMRNMSKKTQKFSMPGVLRLATVICLGTLLGVGLFTLTYARGLSYFSDDPSSCINCHVMQEEYDGWIKGSHASVATCNDCHLPHDTIVNKYLVKAENGFSHSLKFTTGWYPENIEIRESSRRVTNQACLSCHGEFTDLAHIGRSPDEQISCTKCHRDVGHK